MRSKKNPLTREADGSLAEFEPGAIEDASLGALEVAQADIAAWASRLRSVTAGRPMSASERQQVAAVDQFKARIKLAIDNVQASDDALRRGGDPGSVNGDVAASRIAAARAGLSTGGAAVAHQHPVGRRFADMFPQASGSLEGWADPSEFLRTVGLGLQDQRLKMHGATMTGTDSGAGGFSIPPGVFGPWLDDALEEEVVRPGAMVWPIVSGRSRQVPAWDLGDASGGAVAGLTINWAPEGPDVDPDTQTAKMRLLTLTARRGAIFAEASRELEADGFDFQSQMGRIMTRAISFGLDESFLFGTGANEPMGIFSSPALISITRNTANKILYDDVVAMFARMSPASITNSVWLANPTCIPELAKLSLPVGTGGSQIPVMTENAGRFVLLTRPIIFTSKMKALGTAGDLAILDRSQYVIGLRQDATLDKSLAPGWMRNKISYRLQLRVDGMPNISTPYTPLNGDTHSPFVRLS